MILSVIFVVVPFCLSVAALSDLFFTTIPNRVSMVVICSFLLIAPLMGLGFVSIASHLLLGLAVFGVCFCFFIFNTMGGGDAKFLTAMAIWFGWNSVFFQFLLLVSLLGGLLTIFILFLRKISCIFNISIPQSFLLNNKIPYGIAISIGGLITYPDSCLFKIALGQIS
ncbi:MAG: peptidase [Candidatus Liberibacter europaeus]|uniref:Peptidase n=1 Tax=Candidatus Liberibacter europaeus TaxID=744859 RepID=A0A2T4VXJ0_9HYPH|nr:peptidase [Candidatus Liberibacter europaeus]PTL86494.1 MAG: peptidase [Candidatus Liberibacter europaeus]